MNLKLKKFDMKSIKDDKVIVLIGNRETGKSFLVKDLLYYHRNIPVGNVISATESANCFYGNIIPSIFIHDEYTPETIENFLKRQKTVKKQMKDPTDSLVRLIVLTEEVEHYKTMLMPHDTGHIHTTINFLEERIKDLQEIELERKNNQL